MCGGSKSAASLGHPVCTNIWHRRRCMLSRRRWLRIPHCAFYGKGKHTHILCKHESESQPRQACNRERGGGGLWTETERKKIGETPCCFLFYRGNVVDTVGGLTHVRHVVVVVDDGVGIVFSFWRLLSTLMTKQCRDGGGGGDQEKSD